MEDATPTIAAQRTAPLSDLTVVYLEAPARTPVPVVYLHGVPTDADDWLPFLALTGGIAPDLPGFGRSDKPPHFDYSIGGYARALAELVDHAGLDRFSLVMHDWGAVGLALAQAMPQRVERLVAIDCVPFLRGYRWHRFARIWRTPLGGELAMGFTTKWALRRLGRWRGEDEPPPQELIDRVWSRFDHGTQRAILKLYRSAPPLVLEAAGTHLERIESPALVAWGSEDPYVPASFAAAYGERLGARVELLEGAGHWPWLDRPELVRTVADFLGAG